MRIFGIAGHGKREVDHVGGLAKVTIRREISYGNLFDDADDMVTFLRAKFESNVNPIYHIYNIDPKDLEVCRSLNKLLVYHTVDGSSLFQVMVFTPGSNCFKAAPRLCICKECKLKLGSCKLYKDYYLNVKNLKKTSLRSDTGVPETQITHTDDFHYPGSICAVPTDDSSSDTFWLIKITNMLTTKESVIDDYLHKIPPGEEYLVGHYLERESSNSKGQLFYVTKKEVYFYKECIVYPFVNLKERKNKWFISNEDYVDVLYFVENTELYSL